MTEETELEDPMYRRWDDRDDICTDDDSEDTNDDVDFDDGDDDDSIRSSGDGGMDSDGDDHDDDDGDYFQDEYDKAVGDTFEDDVARFQSMDILGSSNLLNGTLRGVERGRQHCPRVNWLKEPDLYKEFDFNPPPGKANK